MDKELLEAIRGTVKEAVREAIDAANGRLHGRPQDTAPPWTKGQPESRLESIERAVSGVNRRLTGVEARIDGLEPRLGRLDGRLAGLEDDVSETKTTAQELRRHLRKAELNQ